MWQLSMHTKADDEWSDVGAFENLTAVAKRIIELDGENSNGVFFEFHVLATIPTPDCDCLAEFQHTGRNALFYVRRRSGH